MKALPERADVVVIGAGFAGAATAHALARRGVDVVVLEAEALPGTHSSGRNAAIARRLVEDVELSRLAVESMSTMTTLTTPDGHPIYRRTGGLLLGDAALIAKLETISAAIPSLAAETRRIDARTAVDMVPALAGAHIETGLFVADEGVVDIHGLLQSFLVPLKGRVFTDTAVLDVTHDAGRVTGVVTAHATIHTPAVVDAAGFHANRVAALAGLGPLPFQPVRRHLFVTDANALLAPDSPWVWDGSVGFYFRREAAGLLMCACDQTPWPDDGPIDTPVDAMARQWLAQKYDTHVPGLRDARPTRAWAGLRILTPDGRFVIGHDPRLAGFTWVAGLGGHGMTTACAVGEVAAKLLIGDAIPSAYRAAFAVDRFLRY